MFRWREDVNSIECFLKDIFCLTRFQVWKNIEPSSLCHPQFHQIVFNEITNKKSVCKVIGHDISKLSNYLINLYPEDLRDSVLYSAFNSSLPRDSSWINDRYSKPEKIKDNEELAKTEEEEKNIQSTKLKEEESLLKEQQLLAEKKANEEAEKMKALLAEKMKLTLVKPNKKEFDFNSK